MTQIISEQKYCNVWQVSSVSSIAQTIKSSEWLLLVSTFPVENAFIIKADTANPHENQRALYGREVIHCESEKRGNIS